MMFSPLGTSTPVDTSTLANTSSLITSSLITSTLTNTSALANPTPAPTSVVDARGPNDGDDISIVEQPEIRKETPHTQPGWLENLLKNFYKVIVQQCSVRTRKAFDKNEVIKVCILKGAVKINRKLVKFTQLKL
jgi:hypothetical protein